jgi:hypothetical protein
MVHSTWRAPFITAASELGDGHAEVVVAVGRPDHLVGVGDALDQLLHALAPQGGNRITNGIGNVDRLRPSPDDLVEDAHQEIHFRAHRVLGGKLDVVGVLECELDGLDRGLDHLVGLHAQLLLHVDRTGGDEGMDAPRPGRTDRLAGGTDVAFVGTRQRAHGGMLDGFGDGLDGVGVTRTGGGKSGLDDVDAELFQLPRNAQFLVLGHRCARALLAIAQGGVKNIQTVVHGWLHGMSASGRRIIKGMPLAAIRRGVLPGEGGYCVRATRSSRLPNRTFDRQRR